MNRAPLSADHPAVPEQDGGGGDEQEGDPEEADDRDQVRHEVGLERSVWRRWRRRRRRRDGCAVGVAVGARLPLDGDGCAVGDGGGCGGGAVDGVVV